ncbi:hypothetical protein ACU686_23875 [Yinghuangia aomiensis]
MSHRDPDARLAAALIRLLDDPRSSPPSARQQALVTSTSPSTAVTEQPWRCSRG